jgi:hypothetical protein
MTNTNRPEEVTEMTQPYILPELQRLMRDTFGLDAHNENARYTYGGKVHRTRPGRTIHGELIGSPICGFNTHGGGANQTTTDPVDCANCLREIEEG